MATIHDQPPLDLREQIARIDQRQAKLAKLQVDTKLAIWQRVTVALAAGATLFAAGVAVGKMLLS